MGLDGVEMILTVEEEFKISISDGDAETMMTTRDLIEAVCRKVGVDDDVVDADFEGAEARETACFSQRAFYKVRCEIVKTTGAGRGDVRLETLVEELFPRFKGSGAWKLFTKDLGIASPWYGSWLSGHAAPKTVRDVVDRLVLRKPAYLELYGRWSRNLVREHVRRIVSEQLDVSGFDDDAEFVRDLGMM